RDFFGFSVSRFTIARLANAAADFGKQRLADTLRREAETLFDRLADYERSPSYRRRLRVPGVVTDAGLQKALVALQAVAEERADDSSLEKKDRARASSVARAASTASARLTEGLGLTEPGKVYWIDVDQKGHVKLCSNPVDVSELLRAEL